MGDRDVTAMRLGTEEDMSREEARDSYAQYKRRYTAPTDAETGFTRANLKEIIDKEAKDRLKGDDEYIEAEKAHAALLDEASGKACEIREAGIIPELTAIPTGYSAQKAGKSSAILSQYGEFELVNKITNSMRA